MLYLVGSRFFGRNRPDSDWDYIGADTPKNHEYCEMLGLKQIPSSLPGVRYWGNGYDVRLIDNLEHQLYIRDTAKRVPGIEQLSKAEFLQKLREISNGTIRLV